MINYGQYWAHPSDRYVPAYNAQYLIIREMFFFKSSATPKICETVWPLKVQEFVKLPCSTMTREMSPNAPLMWFGKHALQWLSLLPWFSSSAWFLLLVSLPKNLPAAEAFALDSAFWRTWAKTQEKNGDFLKEKMKLCFTQGLGFSMDAKSYWRVKI